MHKVHHYTITPDSFYIVTKYAFYTVVYNVDFVEVLRTYKLCSFVVRLLKFSANNSSMITKNGPKIYDNHKME